MQQREDELRKLELQRQTLQCSVELEREKQATLECDLQKVQEKLQHALALGSKLEGEKNELADDLKFKVGFCLLLYQTWPCFGDSNYLQNTSIHDTFQIA